MKHVYGAETFFHIHEVYYEDDKVILWTKNEVSPYGGTPEELLDDFLRMYEAFDRPILNYNFPGQP